MAEGNGYSSIGPLDATAQKEAMPLVGLIILAMIVAIVGVFIAGQIVNSVS